MEDDLSLTAATGTNDSESPWSSLLQTGLNIGTNALMATLSRQTPVSQSTGGLGTPINIVTGGANPPAARSSSNWQQYLPWVIGGAVVLALVYFITRK